jgi:hypothetical protein
LVRTRRNRAEKGEPASSGDLARRSNLTTGSNLTRWTAAVAVLAVLAGSVALSDCSSGPSATEKSACREAASATTPTTLSFPPSGSGAVEVLDLNTIRAAEGSNDNSLASAARQWLSALGRHDQAAITQATTAMSTACREIGA